MLNWFDAGNKGVWIFGPHLLEEGQVSLAELLLRWITERKIVRAKVDRYNIGLPLAEIPLSLATAFPSSPVLTRGPFHWHDNAGCAIIQDRYAGFGNCVGHGWRSLPGQQRRVERSPCIQP